MADLYWKIVRKMLGLDIERFDDEGALCPVDGDQLYGHYSFCSLHAYAPTRELAELMSGPNITFFSICDSRTKLPSQTLKDIYRLILLNLAAIINDSRGITANMLHRAIQTGVASSNDYDIVDIENTYLFGLIWRNQLYVSPLGGTQLVIGRVVGNNTNKMTAVSVAGEEEHLNRHVYPHCFSYVLRSEDRFVVIASHGFWKLVSTEEAVRIVHKKSRYGIAKTLLRHALKKCLRRTYLKYSVLIKMTGKIRAKYHDIMNVIVIYLERPVKQTDYSSNVVCVRSDEVGVVSTDVTQQDQLLLAAIGNIAQGEND